MLNATDNNEGTKSDRRCRCHWCCCCCDSWYCFCVADAAVNIPCCCCCCCPCIDAAVASRLLFLWFSECWIWDQCCRGISCFHCYLSCCCLLGCSILRSSFLLLLHQPLLLQLPMPFQCCLIWCCVFILSFIVFDQATPTRQHNSALLLNLQINNYC